MKSVITVKPKQWVNPQKEADNLEMEIQEVNGVLRASYDWKNSKVDIEYDDGEEDFDVLDLWRAIQNTWKFQVLSVS